MITYKIFTHDANTPFKEVKQTVTKEEAIKFIEEDLGVKDVKLCETSDRDFAMKDDILVQKIESFLVHPR